MFADVSYGIDFFSATFRGQIVLDVSILVHSRDPLTRVVSVEDIDEAICWAIITGNLKATRSMYRI